MFGNRRKSRIVNQGPLPGNQSADVNSNALAAASAIGQALKTGQPIPRSNSLQRTHSLQKRSFSSIPRSGSLLGLQTPPVKFQQSKAPASRSNSFNSAPMATQRKPAAPKPKTIKKHVPGPYGLVTIEVPVEEEASQKPARKPKFTVKRSPSLVKPQSKHHFSDVGSTHSGASINSSKRATFAETPLTEINEDYIADYKQEPYLNSDAPAPVHNLGAIEEEVKTEQTFTPSSITTTGVSETLPLSKPELEEAETESTSIEELKELEESKAFEETELEKQLVEDENKTQTQLNGKANAQRSKLSEVVPPNGNSFFEDGQKATFVHVTGSKDSLMEDGSADAPSTAKSTDTDANQSSFTTQDTEPEVITKAGGSSMAQQLRPTIPSLSVNHEGVTELDQPTSRLSLDEQGPASSISSFEKSDEEAKKAKTLKSALKSSKSSSSVYLPENRSAANDAYLSLTTAENTRLNSRLDEPSLTKGSTRRSPSINRQFNQPQQLLRPPQLSNLVKTNGKELQQRPQSIVETRKQNPSGSGTGPNQQLHRPQSYHPDSHTKPPPKANSRQPIPKNTASAAALNAATKKDKQPKQLKKSSFEKERSGNKNAAFKRMSLRDPAIQGNATVESNLGFYRNQAQQQNHHHQQQPQPPPPYISQNGSSEFKSRFNDSDSDLEVPIGNGHSHDFASPSQPLRKPKSHYTLRSPSVNSVLEQSPAKSLPEKRGTRYFSESAKDAKSHQPNGGKEKRSFGGKLKKLFGRSSKD